MSDSAHRSDAAPRTDLVEFRFFTQEEVAEITGFGRDAVAALVKAGAPMFFKRINLGMLMKWMEANHSTLKDLKVRER